MRYVFKRGGSYIPKFDTKHGTKIHLGKNERAYCGIQVNLTIALFSVGEQDMCKNCILYASEDGAVTIEERS